MIDLFYFSGFPVAVLGLGRSGTAAARALQKSGAEVWAWDDDAERREEAAAQGIPLVDLNDCDWRELTSLVLSPGIPHSFPQPHPVVARAREQGCEVVSDIELLARAQREAQYIGITGTNGKSTTTALIGHILELSGREVAVGGNLGTAALSLEGLGPEGYYVLEMSSYQIETTLSITFDVAVLLNISPDHLERHGGMDGYIAAKRRIFHRQTRPRTAVIGVDDSHCRAIYDDLVAADEQTVVPISGAGKVPGGIYVDGGVLRDDSEAKDIAVLDLKDLTVLPGSHNWQNAAAAYAACKALGVAPAVIMACIRSFPGLPHRQELLEVIDSIAFINDSKATNPEAAARALACYPVIFWIAGGRAKETGLEPLEPFLGHVRKAYLIGEAEPSLAEALTGKTALERCGTLERALRSAFADAKSLLAGDSPLLPVILLSPACASFDQFADFEARGDAFRTAVRALPGERSDLEDWSPDERSLQ